MGRHGRIRGLFWSQTMSFALMRNPTWMAAILSLVPLGSLSAGSFVLATDGLENVITHPKGYSGSSTPEVLVSVCVASGAAGNLSSIVRRAVGTWDRQRADVDNLAVGVDAELSSVRLDMESVVLHKLGECLGLGRTNLGIESLGQTPGNNATRSTRGPNAVHDAVAGPDQLFGSRDDSRGDDVNLNWFHIGSNHPLALPAIIDGTTFTRNKLLLPVGHWFPANGDRQVLAALGIASTESVMQQTYAYGESKRRLTAEDVATLRLAQAGLDGVQGTADDYTLRLQFAPNTSNCDIPVSFVSS
jgi:hypothetical protein